MSALFRERNRSWWWLVAGFVATCYIIGSSYLGLNGRHAFRQADVYSQLLGFAHTPGFQPLDLFHVGQQAVFDIPIYQAILGTLARWTHIDPLILVRYANLLCLLLTAVAGYRLCTHLIDAVAGVVFVALLSTSRLMLHYHSVPLPDNLSMALSLWGIQILWTQDRHRDWLLAGLSLTLAALIKSPIPFVFLVYFVLLTVLSRKMSEPWRQWLWDRRALAAILVMSLIAALGAEFMRKRLLETPSIASALDPRWYFGDLSLRMSAEYWERLIGRLHSASSQLLIPIFLLISVACCFSSAQHAARRTAWIVLCSAFVSYLTGWLVFANVYFMHDYYQLPVICISLMAFAVVFGALNQAYAGSARTDRTIRWLLHAALILTLLGAVLRLVYSPLSERERASFELASEFALQHVSHFVYVSDQDRDPSIGGKRSTKFIQISRQQWARDCATIMLSHPAFLLDKHSPCENELRARARQIVSSDTLTLIVTH